MLISFSLVGRERQGPTIRIVGCMGTHAREAECVYFLFSDDPTQAKEDSREDVN